MFPLSGHIIELIVQKRGFVMICMDAALLHNKANKESPPSSCCVPKRTNSPEFISPFFKLVQVSEVHLNRVKRELDLAVFPVPL